MSDCTDDCDLADICSQRHWSIYWLIIVGSFVFVLGRMVTLGIPTGSGETSPFMSANDRSRWATVRALGDQGTYVIDDVIADPSNRINWDSIDKVKHLDANNQLRTYSSKPTLFPTIVAVVYWCVKQVTGLEFSSDTMLTARIILIVVNAIPWLLYLWLLGKTLERIQIRDWARYFIVTVAGFGTFLSTFAVSLNNHLPAAVAVMATLYFLVMVLNFEKKSWKLYFMTGLASAFAAANELPALSFFCLTSAICLYKSPKTFLLGFVPGAAVVVAAFFGTNYLAHNDWRPAYAHKGDGPLIATVTASGLGSKLDSNQIPNSISTELAKHDRFTAAKIARSNWPFKHEPDVKRWIITDVDHKRLTVVNRGENDNFELRAWDNWYDYKGSYWTGSTKSAVDRGEHNTALYLFHVLFGHHGIFSLTPIWILALAGMLALIYSDRINLRWLAAITLFLTVVVISFYVFWMPGHDRNYGGYTSSFRWALWLTPLWLICMSPIVDWMGKSKRGRAICLFLLLISAISASYSAENPWIHPWLYEFWDRTGLPK